MRFNEKKSQIAKKENNGEGVRKTIINRGCLLRFVHLRNQKYKDKNVFFILSQWCYRDMNSALWWQRDSPLFFLFAWKCVRWSNRPTTHSVDPKLSGPILVIFKLLFRGYHVGLQT